MVPGSIDQSNLSNKRFLIETYINHTLTGLNDSPTPSRKQIWLFKLEFKWIDMQWMTTKLINIKCMTKSTNLLIEYRSYSIF